MKSKLAIIALATSAAFMVPVVGHAADAAATTKTFVKDSAITTKIKTKLAAEKLSSLAKIHVDTDADGMVWLSGTAKTQADIDKAVSIAKATENVRGVKNDIIVKAE